MTQDIKRIVQNQDFLTVLQQARGVLVTTFGASRTVELAFNQRENQRDGHNSFSADESADKIEIRHLTPESKSPRSIV